VIQPLGAQFVIAAKGGIDYNLHDTMRPFMPEEFQYDLFPSHSSEDKAVVRPLAARLRADGPKVWFDEMKVDEVV